MPRDTTTRWTVSVSKDTDIAVRSFLERRGMKKGDLSKFIEDAVKWRVLDQTMAEARGKFADLPPEALESMIDEAVTTTRQANAPKARCRVRLVSTPRSSQSATSSSCTGGCPDRAASRDDPTWCAGTARGNACRAGTDRQSGGTGRLHHLSHFVRLEFPASR